MRVAFEVTLAFGKKTIFLEIGWYNTSFAGWFPWNMVRTIVGFNSQGFWDITFDDTGGLVGIWRFP